MDTITIPVLYQDHHLCIVNKPAGLVVHPTYKHADGTMWDALLAYLQGQQDDWQPPILPDEPEWVGAPEPIREMLRARRSERLRRENGILPRPCLLHRLDKDTSGVVALARTENARRAIVRQFHDHSIDKRYLAVVQRGAPTWATPRVPLHITAANGELLSAMDLSREDEFLLDGPLQRDLDDRRRCIVGAEGQEAQTQVRVLVRADELLLLDVRPLTGRTHQIRAHLAAAGYAILGDQTYRPSCVPMQPSNPPERQFLHAYQLTLYRYPDQERVTFTAPLAPDLSEWLQRFAPPLYEYLKTAG